MTVAVITDSTATIPPALASRYRIKIVPVRVVMGGEVYRDHEVDPKTLLARTEEASTSGPTPADFVTAVEEVREESPDVDAVLIATVSHDLGGSTLLSARTAAGLVPLPARAVDTATAAGGQGLVVLEASRIAEEGATLEEVEAAALRVADRVQIVATLPNLDHLVRSGHVPDAAAWAARWIGLRPVVSLRRGKVTPLVPALSESAALARVLETWRRSRPAMGGSLHVAALHSLSHDEAERLIEVVRVEAEPVTSFVGSFGSAMLLHSGPGVVGLGWWWDERS